MSSSILAQTSGIACLGNVRAARAAHMGGFVARPAAPQVLSTSAAKPAIAERKATVCHAAAAQGASIHTVAEIMTKGGILTCSPDTSLDDALELLVEHHVTGLPVVNSSNVVVGVVSDFDLLALEGVSAKEKAQGFFPEASAEWDSFYDIKKLISKNQARNVGDVMTDSPITVTPETSIEEAANLLLRRKIRRLPVVDASGVLVGIITRSNVIKAAWEARKAGGHL